MPYRYRRGRKQGFRKYKKKYTNYRKLAKSYNKKDGMPTKIKLRMSYPYEIPPSTSVGTFVQTWFSLTSPLYPVNSLLDTYDDWPSIAQLYDYYRPTGLRIKFIPNYNVNQITATPISYIFPMYVAHDYDNIDMATAGMSDQNEMLEIENCKVYQYDRSWAHYVRTPPYNTVLDANLAPITGTTKGGYIPTQSPGYNGIIGVGMDSPITTSGQGVSIGTFIVTLYLRVYSRK